MAPEVLQPGSGYNSKWVLFVNLICEVRFPCVQLIKLCFHPCSVLTKTSGSACHVISLGLCICMHPYVCKPDLLNLLCLFLDNRSSHDTSMSFFGGNLSISVLFFHWYHVFFWLMLRQNWYLYLLKKLTMT
jgi:hypothetical protein